MNGVVAIQKYGVGSSQATPRLDHGPAPHARPQLIAAQCAWCRKVRVDGRYTDLGLATLVHSIDLPARSGVTSRHAVSHGICPACEQRLRLRVLAA